MKPPTENEFAAFIGLDWADAKHDLCLQPAGTDQREFVVLPHRADAIEAWARALRQRFAGRPVALCLEIAKGPLVYALQKRISMHDSFRMRHATMRRVTLSSASHVSAIREASPSRYNSLGAP